MKSGMGKLLTFIMAAFLLVFACYHAYRHFFSDYTTENVYRYTVYHSTTAQGVFFREEKSLDQSAGSNLRYAVRDGEKVRVGSVLAYRYSDALSADLAERRAEAQKELTMLQRVLAQLQSSNTPTVSDLTRNTDIDLQKLAEALALPDAWASSSAMRASSAAVFPVMPLPRLISSCRFSASVSIPL